jgi:hypothetical protein
VTIRLVLIPLLLCTSRAFAGPVPTGDTGTGTTTGTETTTGPTGSTGTTGDTGVPGTDTGLDLDEDRDGYTPREGDCDDANRDLNPAQVEVCSDRFDNDCNGLYDDGCDDSAKLASLRGGGGCTGGQNVLGTQSVLLLGLATLIRRNSRGRR